MSFVSGEAPKQHRRFCHLCGVAACLSASFEKPDFCYSCGASFRPVAAPLPSKKDLVSVGVQAPEESVGSGQGFSTPLRLSDAAAQGSSNTPVLWKCPSSPFFDASMRRAVQALYSIVSSDRLYYSHHQAKADGEPVDNATDPPPISVYKAVEDIAEAHEAALHQVAAEHRHSTTALTRQLRAAMERADLADGDAALSRARLEAAQAETARIVGVYEAQLQRMGMELQRSVESEKRHQQELLAAQALEVRAAWQILMTGLAKT
jgi:hypothetical protein